MARPYQPILWAAICMKNDSYQGDDGMTRSDLITAIEDLSVQMTTVATALDYYGGLDKEITEHAFTLANASAIVASWTEGLKEEK